MFEDRRSVVSRANTTRSGFRAVSETSLTGERHGSVAMSEGRPCSRCSRTEEIENSAEMVLLSITKSGLGYVVPMYGVGTSWDLI